MSEFTSIPPGILYGAFGAMGTAIAALWAFLSKSIEQERKRADASTLGMRKELDQCEAKHIQKDEELQVLSGKVNTIIGQNEGYIAARDDLQGLSEAVNSIDHSLKTLSGQVLEAIHSKGFPDDPERS